LKRRGKVLAGVAVAGVTAAALLLAGPRPIGPATYVVVARGQSMQPKFHVGDLVVVRAGGPYRTGEVVAFHSDLNRVVLHRIIAVHGDRLQTRGDNNNFVDPFEPPVSAVIGKLWWSVPKVGRYVAALRQPRVAGFVVGALLVLTFAGAGARRRRRRSRDAVSPETGEAVDVELEPGAQLPRSPRFGSYAAAASAVALVLGAASGLAWARPLRAAGSVDTQLDGTFSYRAATPAGTVFGARGSVTGQPVFFKTSKTLAVSYALGFTSEAAHDVAGDVTLTARLSAADGWAATLPVARTTPFHGDASTTSGTLDLVRVQSLIAALEKTAGVANGPYTLDLTANARVHGAVALRPYGDTFTQSARFRLDQFQMQVDQSNLQPGVSPFASSHTAALSLPGARPNTMKLAKWTFSVGAVRRNGATGAAAAAALALVLFFLSAPWRSRDEFEEIEFRYGDVLVPVRAAPSGVAIDVESFEAIERVASQTEQVMLLHRAEPAVYVRDGATLYRYGAAVERAPEPEAAERFEYEPPQVGPSRVVMLHETARESDAV
jgi:signal peptidase I